MRRAKLILLLAAMSLMASSGALAEPQPLDLLIIDETKTVAESVCVEYLARAIVPSGLFALDARFDIPTSPNTTNKRYDIVVIIPEKILQVWLITTEIPALLAPPLPQALDVIKEAAKAIYTGTGCPSRQPVHIADDFAPAIYATILSRGGWLKESGD